MTMSSENDRQNEEAAKNQKRRSQYANRLWHHDEERFARAMLLAMPSVWFFRDRYTKKLRKASL